jgi:hypothetical protein
VLIDLVLREVAVTYLALHHQCVILASNWADVTLYDSNFFNHFLRTHTFLLREVRLYNYVHWSYSFLGLLSRERGLVLYAEVELVVESSKIKPIEPLRLLLYEVIGEVVLLEIDRLHDTEIIPIDHSHLLLLLIVELLLPLLLIELVVLVIETIYCSLVYDILIVYIAL